MDEPSSSTEMNVLEPQPTNTTDATSAESYSSKRDGRPALPEPSSSVTEVQTFLADFLFAIGHSRSAAEADALRLGLDGRALYETSLETWNREVGFRGQHVYNALQQSRYGEVHLPFILILLPSLQELKLILFIQG